MKKNGKLLISRLFIMLLLFSLFTEKTITAEEVVNKTGIVNTATLNVRTGPGTSNPILKLGETEVKLSEGTMIEISEILSGWYKVKFTFNETPLTGYVNAEFITLNRTPNPAPLVIYKTITTYQPIKVPGKTRQAVNVKKTANGANLVLKKKAVVLKKARSIKVLGQTLKKKKIWYQVSFFYKGKTRKGYINGDEIKFTLATPATAQIFNTAKSVKVYKTASAKAKQLVVTGKKMNVKKNVGVNIINEKMVKGVKWYRISFTYAGKEKKGYILAKHTKLIKKKIVTRKAISPLTSKQFEDYLTAQGFPESYKPALRLLHERYPFWQFEAYHTKLSWPTVIKNESVPGLNLLPVWYGTEWKSNAPEAYNPETGKYKVYDGSTWVAASSKAVSYYMDPRNFLTASGVFQFELLEYQADYQVATGVDNIMKNTPFRAGKSFSYNEELLGVVKPKTITYTNTIMNAAKASGVSPYHLAARIRQEVVRGVDAVSDSVSGTVKQYPNIYNFYNIGANHGKNPILNGLLWASGDTPKATTYSRPWNNPYKAIVGGAGFLGQNYINKGQNTIYLEKFNVTANAMYKHQFMANVEAAYSESISSMKAYGSSLDEMPLIFSIPVYLNMPNVSNPKPSGDCFYK